MAEEEKEPQMEIEKGGQPPHLPFPKRITLGEWIPIITGAISVLTTVALILGAYFALKSDLKHLTNRIDKEIVLEVRKVATVVADSKAVETELTGVVGDDDENIALIGKDVSDIASRLIVLERNYRSLFNSLTTIETNLGKIGREIESIKEFTEKSSVQDPKNKHKLIDVLRRLPANDLNKNRDELPSDVQDEY